MPKYIPEVKINNETYFVKDSEARGLISNLSQSINIKANKADAAAIIENTITNVAVANVIDGTKTSLPIRSLKFRVDPVQSGIGDPSPINVRQLSGRSIINIIQNNENLVSGTIGSAAPNSSGVISTHLGSRYNTAFAPIKKGVTYTFTRSGDIVYAFYSTAPSTGSIAYDGTWHTDSTTFVAPIDGWVAIRVGYNYTGDKSMIVVGTALGDYVRRSNYSHYVSFGSTVYGADVDYLGATAISDMGLVTFNGASDEAWERTSDGVYYKTLDDMKFGRFMNGKANWLKTLTESDISEFGIQFGSSNRIIYIRGLEDNISDISDIDSFLSYLNAHNLTICYPLKNTITINLSNPATIDIIGSYVANNFWLDYGNIVELVYPCDTKAYIDRKIEELRLSFLENN